MRESNSYNDDVIVCTVCGHPPCPVCLDHCDRSECIRQLPDFIGDNHCALTGKCTYPKDGG